MGLENIILEKCVEISDIPVNNLEDLTVSYCIGTYRNSKGIELPVSYVELRTSRYNFSDYDESIESAILIDYGKRIVVIPLEGNLEDNFDIITKNYEAEILDPKIIFNNSRKSRKIKRDVYNSIKNYFSKSEKSIDEDEKRERISEVLSSIKHMLNNKYREAINSYL